MSSEHDYKIAAEPDNSGKANRHIVYYFLLLGVLLFATIGGLTIMYRFQVEYEQTEKIGLVKKREAVKYDLKMRNYVSGKEGLLDGKAHIPVEDAKRRFIDMARKGSDK